MSNNQSKWEAIINDYFGPIAFGSVFILVVGFVIFAKNLSYYKTQSFYDDVKATCNVSVTIDYSYEQMNNIQMLNDNLLYDYGSKNSCKLYELSPNLDIEPVSTDDLNSNFFNRNSERVLITYRDDNVQFVNGRTMDVFPYYNSVRDVVPYKR